MWSKALKVLGASLLTFALVWALVLGWWQSNDHEPSRMELGLYLAALPLALVGGFLLLRGFIDHLKADPESAAAPHAPVRDDDPLALASAKMAAAERGFTIALADAFVVTAGGNSIDDTLAAIEEGKRPAPCSRLYDDDGFPVFAAEVTDLDTEAVAVSLAEHSGSLRDLADREQIVRTLCLIERIVELSSERLRGMLEQATATAHLQVCWIVPAAWKGLESSALKDWLGGQLANMPAHGQLDIAVIPANNELDALRVLDDIILRTNRDTSRVEVTLLLGATSAVDEQTVSQRDAANRLFSSQHQLRQIPGEGAVALILAGDALIEQLGLSDSIRLSRLGAGVRDKPVDAGGRITGKLIEQIVTGLLDVTGVEHAAIKKVMLDTDHRANHLTEVLEAIGHHFAHLEPIKDCPTLGTTSGDLSPISGLAALACARNLVLVSEAPVLSISNQHQLERGVLLAMPAAPVSDIKSSST